MHTSVVGFRWHRTDGSKVAEKSLLGKAGRRLAQAGDGKSPAEDCSPPLKRHLTAWIANGVGLLFAGGSLPEDGVQGFRHGQRGALAVAVMPSMPRCQLTGQCCG
jgi:hypothetical protein